MGNTEGLSDFIQSFKEASRSGSEEFLGSISSLGAKDTTRILGWSRVSLF